MNIKLKDILDLIGDDLLSIYSFSERRQYWDGQINELDENGQFVRSLKDIKPDLKDVALAHLDWYVCGLGSSIDGGIIVSVTPRAPKVENEIEIDYEEKYKRLIKNVIRISQDFSFNQSLCLVVDHIDKDIVDDIAKIREEETKKHIKNFLENCQKIHHLLESEEK